MADPKFRYVVVSLFDGKVHGTNHKETAENWASSEDDWVIDMLECKHLTVVYDDNNVETIEASDIEELPQIEPTDEENQNGN